MADPHHVPELDGFDRLTVSLYRAGLITASLGVLGLGVGALAGLELDLLRLLVLVGVLLAVVNMHLYDKRIRWLIAVFGTLGALLTAAQGLHPLVGHAGLGFAFAALSAFALKEQFCFRVPGMRLVPLLLASSLIPLWVGPPMAVAVLLVPSGILLCILVFAKLRMPLHFDVGNKAHYQV